MRSARLLLACVLAVPVFVMGIPSNAVAATASKGTVRGDSAHRAKPPVVDRGSVRANSGEWEPDDNISIATPIDDALADGTDVLTGSLAVYSDYDDVYEVFLYAGETISLSMNADGGTTDFGLYLFGPGATDVYTSMPVAAVDPYYFGGPSAYPLNIEYEVGETGYYYINPGTWLQGVDDGGSGSYAINVSILRQATGVNISSPTTFNYLSPTYISGQVVSSRGGMPSGNAVLYMSYNGVQWMPLREQPLNAGGTYSFRGDDAYTSTYYMVLYEGTSAFGSSANTTHFGSRARLSGVSATRLGTRKYRLSGNLGPQHASGTSPVRIYLWRKVNGVWRAAGYQNAVASNYGSESKFTKTYTFPYKGSWRMQAYHSDAGHVTTRSGFTYKSVY